MSITAIGHCRVRTKHSAAGLVQQIHSIPDAIDPTRPDGRSGFRRDQYRVAYNLTFNGDDVPPWMLLQRVATEVDIVSRAIELVQDALVGMQWKFSYSDALINQIKYETNEKNNGKAQQLAHEKYGDELTRVQNFFERPDRKNDYSFSQWLTSAAWSHLTYDGVVIAPQYTYGGKLHSLRQIDTSTIKILKDKWGDLQAPPAPAYSSGLYRIP